MGAGAAPRSRRGVAPRRRPQQGTLAPLRRLQIAGDTPPARRLACRRRRRGMTMIVLANAITPVSHYLCPDPLAGYQCSAALAVAGTHWNATGTLSVPAISSSDQWVRSGGTMERPKPLPNE